MAHVGRCYDVMLGQTDAQRQCYWGEKLVAVNVALHLCVYAGFIDGKRASAFKHRALNNSIYMRLLTIGTLMCGRKLTGSF